MTHDSSSRSSPSAPAPAPEILERGQLAADIARRVGVSCEEAGALADVIFASVSGVLARPRPSPRRAPRPAPVVEEATARAFCDQFIASVSEYPAHRFGGRGVVTCAGGPRLLACAWVLLNMLRRTGCSLPVELWHLGEEEVDTRTRELLAPLGVACVDALHVRERHPVRILNGWELKPYAIRNSAFEEVVFLDADNVPLLDPASLFDSVDYRRTGALFWPDVEPLARTHPIFGILDLRFRDEPAFESGQIVISKRRHWRPLALAMHMNEHSDFYYRYVHGDKETFHLAFRLLDADYAMVPTPVHRLRGGVFCQHDTAGRRMFQHRLAKWERRDLHIEGFEREQECFDLLRRFDEAYGETDESPL
jgi:hypothetical protein